jgi:hypothetical protein
MQDSVIAGKVGTDALAHAVGKTIAKVTYGTDNDSMEDQLLHRGEWLQIGFTDGSTLRIETHSNAASVAQGVEAGRLKPLRATDFHSTLFSKFSPADVIAGLGCGPSTLNCFRASPTKILSHRL